MISIPQRDLRRLMNSPHRIPAFHGRGSRERVVRAVGDEFGQDVSTAVTALARQRLIRMDDVSCALMEAHGVNPAVTAALREEIHLFTVTSGFSPVCVVETAMHVRIGGSAAWWYPASSTITGLHAVPQTIAGELPGKPLSTLVSHPALDGLPLVIESLGVHDTTAVKVTGATWLSEELERYAVPKRQRGEPVAETAG